MPHWALLSCITIGIFLRPGMSCGAPSHSNLARRCVINVMACISTTWGALRRQKGNIGRRWNWIRCRLTSPPLSADVFISPETLNDQSLNRSRRWLWIRSFCQPDFSGEWHLSNSGNYVKQSPNLNRLKLSQRFPRFWDTWRTRLPCWVSGRKLGKCFRNWKLRTIPATYRHTSSRWSKLSSETKTLSSNCWKRPISRKMNGSVGSIPIRVLIVFARMLVFNRCCGGLAFSHNKPANQLKTQPAGEKKNNKKLLGGSLKAV